MVFILKSRFLFLCVPWMAQECVITDVQLFILETLVLQPDETPDEDVYIAANLEQFSFECRKIIGFAFGTPHDWLKKFAPNFHPVRSKTKTNRDITRTRFPALCVSYL